MATNGHLKRVRQGASAWNAWREQNPDLHGADLHGAQYISAAQLAQAKNLEYACLDDGRFADAVAAGYVLSSPISA